MYLSLFFLSSGLGRDCGEVLEHGVCDTRSGHCVCGDTRPIRIRDTCVGGEYSIYRGGESVERCVCAK